MTWYWTLPRILLPAGTLHVLGILQIYKRCSDPADGGWWQRSNTKQAGTTSSAAKQPSRSSRNFNWDRLALPSETDYQVPGTGLVQRVATSLFAKIPLLTGRDQHEARFVLQVISLQPLAGLIRRRPNMAFSKAQCILHCCSALLASCFYIVNGGNRFCSSSWNCSSPTGSKQRAKQV